MSEIVDITDREPNPALIAMLEQYLEQARSGYIRSALVVASYADSGTCHSWVLDSRTWQQPLFAQVTFAQMEMAMNMSLNHDGILSMALRGET